MEITLFDAVQVAQILAELKQINGGILPPKISGNLAYIRPEIQKWYQLSDSERDVFGDAEIDLPLKKITKDDLPGVMPSNMYEPLNPIAKKPFKNEKTQLEKLMEKSKKEAV